ncbi:glycoside hydrolase family 15 protein [Kitasatospora paranensis]|uniref:Glycoside hydrolase family 15 protein n=1 Tax=Kitasatospora paranensis TaxID=258053 RepID=A0ABW2G8W6_9ACTN
MSRLGGARRRNRGTARRPLDPQPPRRRRRPARRRHRRRHRPRHAGRWDALADRITARTAAAATHPTGRWQRTTTDPGVDAALLLPALRGAVPADDPHTLATLEAVRSDLCEDHYTYRFRHDERPMEEAEGAFLLCGFLMALAEHQQGRAVEAARGYERNRAACGPPGLYAEEFDIARRQLRGSLPQAFVHGLMLEAAVRLARPVRHGELQIP